ncbi:hypothetical protein VTL71DRAFT_11223 [Oculimacula yallundae]|uniref:Uncharacterized protein n=1 Tax=Oculimacula yallundae TaxID=86028 RepID=A0ABR4CVN5_9HELO
MSKNRTGLIAFLNFYTAIWPSEP